MVFIIFICHGNLTSRSIFLFQTVSSWLLLWVCLRLWSLYNCCGWTWSQMVCLLQPWASTPLIWTSWTDHHVAPKSPSSVAGSSSVTWPLEVWCIALYCSYLFCSWVISLCVYNHTNNLSVQATSVQPLLVLLPGGLCMLMMDLM